MATIQEIWEYGNRNLTSSGNSLKMTDLIQDPVTLPVAGDLTVIQLLNLLLQRLTRNKKTKI